MSYWKILRVLVSDFCNYHCVFCHNEGQSKDSQQNKSMPYDHFEITIKSLKQSEFKEVQFSGGETFANPATIKMIEMVNSSTNWEIGCATNGQLLSDGIAERLGKTRVKLNINLPSLNDDIFKAKTGGGSLSKLKQKLTPLDAHKVDYAFNSVIQTGGLNELFDLIDFCWERGKRLKILPYIDIDEPAHPPFLNDLYNHLDSIATSSSVQPTNRKWKLSDRGNGICVIKIVDSPCYDLNIHACKDYGEVRLLPDFSIQPCLINSTNRYQIEFGLQDTDQENEIKSKFEKAWMNFSAC